MLIEIHMLQNHAPSNLNRDDTGSPKEAHFGGYLRARISSQCIKRSIRTSEIFRQAMSEHLAVRTKRLGERLQGELLALGRSEAEVLEITRKASMLGSGQESKESEARQIETRQLMFLADSEVATLAGELNALWLAHGDADFRKMKLEELEKKLSPTLPRSVDVALFGRMTTSPVFPDVPAALQVAHAISTGKVDKQYDYYTAVDDLVQASEETGAGMIGDVEFNSATYYKYFCLDWPQLVRNLTGKRECSEAEWREAERVAGPCVAVMLQAAAFATPTGKQNSFAAHNPPDAILVEIKERRIPTSYANAFLTPISPDGNADVVERSIMALAGYAVRLKSTYALAPRASLWLSTRGPIEGSDRMENLDALIDRALAGVSGGES
jgi:CRISPR system Cascade subunit CasC